MEGDAVLAQQGYPTGETFLATFENLYNAFATRLQNIIANTAVYHGRGRAVPIELRSPPKLSQ